jgi:PAS domain S-box-containing protein
MAMYGLDLQQENWTYKDFLKYIHPDDLNDFLDSGQKNTHSQIDVSVSTFRILRPDGLIRHIENTGMVLRNEVNKPVRMIGVTRDVTERWLAEETLRESEQRFREIAENVDEVFFIHSAEPFTLLYINPAYERIWNRTTQSLYEDPYSFLDIVLDEDKPDLIEFFQQYKNGNEGQIIYRIQNPDGSFQWLLFRSFVKRDDFGNIIRLIGIINDITGQKEKEVVLQQALQREQQLNQLKSQFVSTASHEFRTPLATIQTSVELVKLYLETSDPDAKVSIKKHLSVIEKEVDSFSLLLSDILTIEKIESGKVSFSPQWVDIVSTCKHIIATHFCQGTDKRTVQLTVEGKHVQVYVDEKLISHVIINLLSNAFKFSHSSPSMKISFLDDRFLLQVLDDGIGIPESEITTLFQAFFRATNTIGIPGTGLGLVIAMQFVELHGGTITVKSKEKKGTTFRVSLPIRSHDTAIGHYPGQPTPASVQKTS